MLQNIDLDKLNRLTAENPDANEIISQLLENHKYIVSKISHEIRNPLTLVSSTLQLVESQHPDLADYKYWPNILADVQYMTYLLNELSTFNNGERLTKTSFLPEPFFKHLSISFAASLEDSQVTFTSLIQPSLDKITGDKTKLQEVFLNLLRNAYESITSTGNINFSVTKADNNFLAIRITDDGCGMTHKQIDSMYTAFTTYKKNGSGLGLAIVKRVVDAHKGRIEVSSSLGVGSTFTVFLPIK